MAQRIDWDAMPHDEMVAQLSAGAEVRDKRVRELMDADKPKRRQYSGKNGATEHTEAV